MKKILQILLLLALAPVATAGGIKSGTYSNGQGYTVKIEVSDTNGQSTPGVDVTVTDAGGSRVANGVQHADSTVADPRAKSFTSGTTPRGAVSVRGDNSKVQYQNAAGDWITLTRLEEPKGANDGIPISPGVYGSQADPAGLERESGGEEGGSLPGGPQKL